MKRANHDVDTLAGHLASWARIARSMPPAFQGAGVGEPVVAPGGEVVGRMLDGKGLVLFDDLKRLGITKKIPYVYERSPLARILERVRDERAAIGSYDDIINARLVSGKSDDKAWNKSSFTTVSAAWSTTFRAGGIPPAGTYTNIPTGAVLLSTNAGALSAGLLQPPASNSKFLLAFGFATGNQMFMGMLVDQLVAAGNILATSAVAQTTSTAALTRYTSGAGVYATLDVTTALGGTASNFNLSSYTNQAGTAAQVGPAQAMTTSSIVQRLQPAGFGPQIQLANGDYGIQAVSTVTFSASMLAGVVALVLYKPLVWMPGMNTSTYQERDATVSIDGLVQLPVDGTTTTALGCLALYVLPNATSTGATTGFFRTVSG